MTHFYIYLAIVLAGVAICIDWAKVIRDIWEGFVTLTLHNSVAKYIRRTVRAYQAPPGRHRADREPTDSEVDRWNDLWGADDRFADFLHAMNRDFHMNDQARA